MAIAVVRASSQYAEATSSCLGSGTLTTFTLAGWYKPSSIANGTVIGIGRSSTAPYIAMGMDGSGLVFIEVSDGSGVNVTGGTLSNGVWAHIGGVQASATSRTAYLNGAAGTTNTTSKTPSGLDRTTIGGLVLNGSRLSFAGGDIGECSVWNVALTTAEMLMLAAGMSPLCVRPQSLVFYAPLTQATSPEQDLRGSLALTFGAAGAAPTKATSHPRVFKPISTATVLVPSSTITNVAVTQASTTDTAIALSRQSISTITLASDANSALAISRSSITVVGTASDSSIAQSVSKTKQKTISLPSETNTAQVIGTSSLKTITAVSETNTASVLGKAHSRVLGIASSSDTATSLTSVSLQVISQASTSDTGQLISRASLTSIITATSSSQAQAISTSKLKAISTASSTDISQSLVRVSITTIGQASTSGQALPISTPGHIFYAVVDASTTDSGSLISTSSSKIISATSESDLASSVTRLHKLSIGQAQDFSTATSISRSKIKMINLASDISSAILVNIPVGIRTATGTDTAMLIIVGGIKKIVLTTSTHIVGAEIISHRIVNSESDGHHIVAELELSQHV